MSPTKAGHRGEAEHVIALMVLAACADGRVEGSEAFAIQRIVSADPLLAHVRPVSAISDETRARLREKGMDAALEAECAALPDRTYRELAFQCCAKVMAADRSFPAEEASMLKKLQGMLGLESSDAERLLVLATR
jgi:hypothetical protein